MKIGHKLAELRGKLKFSQQEVSDKLNIKQGTYNKWENNTTTPSCKYLPKLAEVFNTTISELYPQENLQVVNAETITNSQIQSPIETINNNIDVEKIIAPLHETIKELLQQNATKDATIQKLLEQLASK